MFTNRISRVSGVTLPEFLVSVGIASIVIIAVSSLSLYTSRSFVSMSNYATLDQQSQLTLDRMTRMIRQANSLTQFSLTNLVFDIGPSGPLTYQYDAIDRELVEVYGTNVTILLEGCDGLKFDVYQRNTSAGTFNQFPHIATTNTAKVVQVSWSCSREVLGAKFNTESIQSAKIVIRK